MEQKTTEHRITLRFSWGLADMVLGNFVLPCWAVYECLDRLSRTDSFTDESLDGQFVSKSEYDTLRFVASQLCEHNILSWDAGANRYERGEHYLDYREFFENYIQSWTMEYSLTNRPGNGYACHLQSQKEAF